MFITMVIAALAIDGIFTLAGIVPDTRPSRAAIFAPITVDYKLVLNVLATVVFAALFGLTMRRGATDPVCGMQVDRAKGLRAEYGGRTFVFCSEHCLHRFQADPERYASGRGGGAHDHAHAH
jgi:YHS domain-containing protein